MTAPLSYWPSLAGGALIGLSATLLLLAGWPRCGHWRDRRLFVTAPGSLGLPRGTGFVAAMLMGMWLNRIINGSAAGGTIHPRRDPRRPARHELPIHLAPRKAAMNRVIVVAACMLYRNFRASSAS